MSKSQNGWPTVTKGLVSLPQVTGKVLGGPVWVVMYWLCEQFAQHVEPITKAWSWGWSYRKIAGSKKWSNHASGTAVDLNAPRHGAGKLGTFTRVQVEAVSLILKASGGVLRWGHLFKDEMHFEIAPGTTRAEVAALANTVLQVALAELGLYHGRPDGVRGPLTRSALLAFQAAASLTVDGVDGPKTWAAISAARNKMGETK